MPFTQQEATSKQRRGPGIESRNPDSESDFGSPSGTNSPATTGGTVAQGMKLDFKGKPGYGVMSGHGKRIYLTGNSAGGNLCFTVSLRAADYGVWVPDGIIAAYFATMLQSTASPSCLLSLMDPLLPLGVLSKCVSTFTGKAHTHRAGGLG
ncbi:hypothetical protein HPG69_018118, partial [Diceros bicornis minor]